eukprot:765863-Hanusia_phi.AAC.7
MGSQPKTPFPEQLIFDAASFACLTCKKWTYPSRPSNVLRSRSQSQWLLRDQVRSFRCQTWDSHVERRFPLQTEEGVVIDTSSPLLSSMKYVEATSPLPFLSMKSFQHRKLLDSHHSARLTVPSKDLSRQHGSHFVYNRRHGPSLNVVIRNLTILQAKSILSTKIRERFVLVDRTYRQLHADIDRSNLCCLDRCDDDGTARCCPLRSEESTSLTGTG